MEKKEEYVLTSKEEVLAVFSTLQECLQWIPNCQIIEENLIAWRFYRDERGEVQRQKITISSRIFHRNIQDFLKKIDQQMNMIEMV